MKFFALILGAFFLNGVSAETILPNNDASPQNAAAKKEELQQKLQKLLAAHPDLKKRWDAKEKGKSVAVGASSNDGTHSGWNKDSGKAVAGKAGTKGKAHEGAKEKNQKEQKDKQADSDGD